MVAIRLDRIAEIYLTLTRNFNFSNLFASFEKRNCQTRKLANGRPTMPSGWSTYYVVLLAAVSALLIPAGLAFIGFFVVRMQRGKQPRKDFGVIRPLSETLGEKTNPRYFLAANCAIVLIMLMLSLVPCVVTLAPGSTEGELVRSLLAIIVISGFTGLGLLYASKKGDLSWLRVTRETSPDAVGEKKR